MPVFLHQNVLNEEVAKHALRHFSHPDISTRAYEDSRHVTISKPINNHFIRKSSKVNETGHLPNLKIKQVVKDIFESSVVGGKERHEKMRNVLGKDPEISESLIHENTRVGALFASKAFVQLVINPIVGVATEKIGYQVPFLSGTVILLLSSFSK